MTEEQKQAQRQVIACMYYMCGILEAQAAISTRDSGTVLAIIAGGIEGAAERLNERI